MSHASVEFVRDFFVINNFFVLKKEDILFVRNTLYPAKSNSKFILSADEAVRIGCAVIKIVCWHTMKFSPAVLFKSPEIFDFLTGDTADDTNKFFMGESFVKILVIPSLPVSEELKKESIKVMRDKGVDRLILFPSVLSGLIDRIEPRHVYRSTLKEILRVLKFYKFFIEEEQNLPF